LVKLEPDILLELARLQHTQVRRALEVRRTLSLAQEALSIADRCEYDLKQADCHSFLAQLALEENDLDNARRHAQTTRARDECDGSPHRYEVAFQLRSGCWGRLKGERRCCGRG
jgi:hypothetical protein